jgi:putative oxidoreductase
VPRPFAWFETRKAWAPLFARLFAGTFLVYMSQDNVVSWARMLEFAEFLRAHGFPAPLPCAMVSVYAQFTAGLLFLAGAFVRPAALVMVVNFVVALLGVHLSLPFREALDPSAMLACALVLLFAGAGPWSVDAWRASRGTAGPAGNPGPASA